MAKFKAYDYRQRVFLPVSLEDQLMPGTLEFAIHTLVESRLDTSGFDRPACVDSDLQKTDLLLIFDQIQQDHLPINGLIDGVKEIADMVLDMGSFQTRDKSRVIAVIHEPMAHPKS